MTDKERLERIIQMQYDGYTIWDMGENDLIWLIEQAGRVQELEDKCNYLSDMNEMLVDLNGVLPDEPELYIKLKKENKRYREAIERALDESGWGDEGNALYRTIGILTKALEDEE